MTIVAEGTPEDVARVPGSATGEYLARVLRGEPLVPLSDVTFAEELGRELARTAASTGEVVPATPARKRAAALPSRGELRRSARPFGEVRARGRTILPVLVIGVSAPGGQAQGGAMFRRSRWLTILVPALAVGAIELLSDSLLDVAFPVQLDTILIVGVVLALSAAFSFVAYRRTDALTARLEAQNEALEARNATARALHRVSVAITALGELDPILAAVVDNARELLVADVAVLLLVGPEGRLALRASSGPADAIRPAGGEGTTTPCASSTRRTRSGAWQRRCSAAATRSGSWSSASGSARTFGVDDVEALSSLANQAAIAIENAHLQERLRELAVIAERERIAREMHDGLAQVLGYVNTKSQAVDEYLATGRVDEARAQLAELSRAARSVYVDVREAILGLRSPIVTGVGPRRRRRGVRAALRRGFEAGGGRQGQPGGANGGPLPGGRGAGLPDRPGVADERPQARRGPPGRRRGGASTAAPSSSA